jgi:hypothetical protein
MRVLAASMLALSALTIPADAQQTRYSRDWGRTGQAAEAVDPADAKLRHLTDELKALVDEAARARAADPRFLKDLRELARRYEWAWTRRIVRDDFADGDWTHNPTWAVWGSELLVEGWNGVTMRAVRSAAPPAPARGDRNDKKDLTGALIGTFLGQIARPEGRESGGNQAPPPASPAAEVGMKLAVAVPNAFAIRVALASASPGTGRFEVGVTSGQNNAGYRLAYNAGGSPAFELVRVSQYGSAVIEVAGGPLKLEDGKLHTIQMTRDARDEIAVAVDGKELARIRDRAFGDAFDGILLVDKAGEVRIRSVEVYGAT